jgi:hypothetical protein
LTGRGNKIRYSQGSTNATIAGRLGREPVKDLDERILYMDQNLINLTGVIGANVTLIQPWYAGAIGIIVAAIFGALLAGGVEICIDRKKDKRKKRDDQIQAHSNLLGCKHALLQYLKSYFLADVAARSSPLYARLVAIRCIDFYT